MTLVIKTVRIIQSGRFLFVSFLLAGAKDLYQKSKTSFRTIPISNNLISELENYRTWQNERIEKLGEAYQGKLGDEARLFTTWDGKPVYDSTLRDWLNKFLVWCDVPHVTVHGLRHTFASVLIANGTDVRTTAGLMGHSSPALVMNVYANV